MLLALAKAHKWVFKMSTQQNIKEQINPALQVSGLFVQLQQQQLLHNISFALPAGGHLGITGPSGSGKSTLTVQLATAGWSFLTDDVLVLELANARVTAWAMRRSFAITSETYASSSFLQNTTSLDYLQNQFADKRQFTPHTTFASNFRDRSVPATLFFSELGNVERSSVTRLTTAETMSRLIRMNPWCCYDRSTASEHLATLSGLASQSTGYSLLAGRDLLEPQIAADLLARYAQAGRKQ